MSIEHASRGRRGSTRARVAYLLGLICAAGLFGCAPDLSWARVGEACVNITDVQVTELTNVVLVTIKADGSFTWYDDWAGWIAEGLIRRDERGDYSIGDTGHRFTWWVPNARSKLASSYVEIAKYPVSHVEVALGPPQGDTSFRGEYALRFTFETYVDMRLFYSQEGEGYVDYWQGEDGQSVQIMFFADRQLKSGLGEAPEERFDQEAPTELSVRARDGGLEVKALNAGLHDLARELSRVSGAQVSVARSTDRRVTAALRGLSLDEVLEHLGRGYSLTIGREGAGYLLSEALVSTHPAYVQGDTVVRPMHYLKARDARALLPNFMFPYLRADDRTNVLSVSGPKPLVAHALADLDVVDQPGPNIEVEVTAVESASEQDAERALGIRWSAAGGRFDVDSGLGDVHYANLGGLPSEFQARLAALKTDTRVRTRDRARVVVANGERAELFVGQERFVILETGQYRQYASVEDIPIGVKLSVQALAGTGDDYRLTLEPEVTALAEVDARTRLPVVSTRRASATLRVRDGDTVAVAGLRLVQDEVTRRKIPVLGDLPLIGALFRSRRASHRDSELVLFVKSTRVAATGTTAVDAARTDGREEFDEKNAGVDLAPIGDLAGAQRTDRLRGGAVLQYHGGDARGALQRRADYGESRRGARGRVVLR